MDDGGTSSATGPTADPDVAGAALAAEPEPAPTGEPDAVESASTAEPDADRPAPAAAPAPESSDVPAAPAEIMVWVQSKRCRVDRFSMHPDRRRFLIVNFEIDFAKRMFMSAPNPIGFRELEIRGTKVELRHEEGPGVSALDSHVVWRADSLFVYYKARDERRRIYQRYVEVKSTGDRVKVWVHSHWAERQAQMVDDWRQHANEIEFKRGSRRAKISRGGHECTLKR